MADLRGYYKAPKKRLFEVAPDGWTVVRRKGADPEDVVEKRAPKQYEQQTAAQLDFLQKAGAFAVELACSGCEGAVRCC